MMKPIPIQHVRLLSGPFFERQELNARYLQSVNVDRLLTPFLKEAGLPHGEAYPGWESRGINGHSLGHYLSAVSFLTVLAHLVWPARRVAYILDVLETCQAEDGALLSVPRRVYEEIKAGRIDATPFELNGVWVPTYTVHKIFAGLRDAYRIAGETRALEMERRLADWIIGCLSGLTPEQIQQMLTAEYGGMNEVLCDLSVDTEEEKYLDAAIRLFNMNAVLDPLMAGEDKLDGCHGNTQIPKVLGLARQYELTKESRYRRGATTFWESVARRRSYCMGGNSESEHYFPVEQFPQKLTPHTAETCNTYNMVKLSGHLFAWLPSAELMDFVERAQINHLLANIGRREGEFGYFLGLEAVAVKVFSEPNAAWWCCVGTGMENPTRYTEQACYEDGDELWINLYQDSEIDWISKRVNLHVQTAFPLGTQIKFTINCESPIKFALKLRHPYWCDTPTIAINDVKLDIPNTPSTYLTLERIWEHGDTVDLELPMTLRAETLPHSEDGIVALMYGPHTLAAIVPANLEENDQAKARYGDHLAARGKTDAFPPTFIADDISTILNDLDPVEGSFAHFCSKESVKPINLKFMPLMEVYEEQYAVYMPLKTPSQWMNHRQIMLDQHQRAKQLDAATIDIITPGYQQPEVEHKLTSKFSEVIETYGRKGRIARADGYFAYQIQTGGRSELSLEVTYWGIVQRNTSFEIQIDGKQFTVETIRHQSAPEFINRLYKIPMELTYHKQEFELRFASHRESDTLGVYGIRLISSRFENNL